MRHVLTGAAMILVVGTTAACGGSAPTDASKEDFCEAYGAIGDLDQDSTGEDLQDYGKELEDVGTPDDMSDEERNGFEVYVDALKDADGDKKIEDIDEPDLSDDEEKDAEAFSDYASEKCKDEVPGGDDAPETDDLPTDPGDIETDDIPTDGTTDVPIDPDDVPTDPEEMESYLEDLESEMSDLESP